MQDIEGAISEAKEKVAKLDKLWPSKESRTQFLPKRILCFVDANLRSTDAIKIAIQLSQEFDTDFSIRSLFDKELLKIADDDLAHLKETIIEIVKENLKTLGVNKSITFIEGDAIESVERHLIEEYDIIVLPVPYHSNLSDHPDAVALGSLGEYLINNIEKPLFLVPEITELKEDLFKSVVIVGNDISDIIQNQKYMDSFARNRSHVDFVFLYNAKSIDGLAEASKGVVDAEMVKRRVQKKLEKYGKSLVDRYNLQIEQASFHIFSEEFSTHLEEVIGNQDASLLLIILPEDKKGYQYLLFQDMLRAKGIDIPIMILHVSEKEKKIEKDQVDEEEDEMTEKTELESEANAEE